MNDSSQPPPPSYEELRWYLLQKKTKEARIKRAFELFRSEGIEPILIKGWAADLNYPPDTPRHFTDTDLAVARKDHKRAAELCGTDDFAPLHIDLHRELRDLDTLSWANLFDNSRLVDLDGTDIRILRPEDHLRVMSTHWLLDGGANKERLLDIYYAVANRPADFDWERCLGTVPANRRRWVTSTVGLAHRYFGLDIAGLPYEEEARQIPEWITRCVEAEWRSGVRLEPVIAAMRSPKRLIQQIRMRIPPNPIRATIELEGDLDARSQLVFQLKCIGKMLMHPMGQHRTTNAISDTDD